MPYRGDCNGLFFPFFFRCWRVGEEHNSETDEVSYFERWPNHSFTAAPAAVFTSEASGFSIQVSDSTTQSQLISVISNIFFSRNDLKIPLNYANIIRSLVFSVFSVVFRALVFRMHCHTVKTLWECFILLFLLSSKDYSWRWLLRGRVQAVQGGRVQQHHPVHHRHHQGHGQAEDWLWRPCQSSRCLSQGRDLPSKACSKNITNHTQACWEMACVYSPTEHSFLQIYKGKNSYSARHLICRMHSVWGP